MEWNLNQSFLHCPKCSKRLRHTKQRQKTKNPFKNKAVYLECSSCEKQWVLPDPFVTNGSSSFKVELVSWLIIYSLPLYIFFRNELKVISLFLTYTLMFCYLLLIVVLIIKILIPALKKHISVQESYLLPLNKITFTDHPELIPRSWGKEK